MSSPANKRVPTAQIASLLRDAITRVNRRMRQTRPLGDLTIAQISVLQSLDVSGGLTPRELAETERVQPPTITRIVAKLEERDLVRRTPHPTDGRQVILTITIRGSAIIEEHRRVRDEWLARRIATLTPEDRDAVRRAAEILSRLAREY